MLDLGAFPAVVGGNTKIVGELYEVDKATLASLDRLEGHPSFYERQQICVVTPHPRGGEAEGAAWCYFLSKDSQAHYEKLCPVIEEGIWNGHHA